MEFLSLSLPNFEVPGLDPQFIPLPLFFAAHQKLASQPFAVALQDAGGRTSVYKTKVIGTAEHRQADVYYIERLAKFMLWSRGGCRMLLCGNAELGQAVKNNYTQQGARAFDCGFMQRVYGKPFETVVCSYEECPAPQQASVSLGRHLDGCRIGFDAGGSDRKVSAVVDGKPVFSEEVVWFPKTNANPDYHYEGIVQAFKTAAAKMPRVDAIGISSAGVYVDNQCKVASLFLKVNDKDFAEKVEDIYIRAAKEIGDVPVAVANDGDVTALAGSMGLNDGGVLGIAMGTSEAVGYVDTEGNITGWLNELAFAPLDGQTNAARDEWSGDIGCGVKYLSQDAVIKLAPAAGITLPGKTPAEDLLEVQKLMEKDDARAAEIYKKIGIYLGHALGLYSLFYEIRHVLMLGRVTSGKGGDIVLQQATDVLKQNYPQCNFYPQAPDEKTRRVGQSVAAASLPQI